MSSHFSLQINFKADSIQSMNQYMKAYVKYFKKP